MKKPLLGLLLLTLALSTSPPVLARGLPLPSPNPDRGAIAVTLRLKPPLGAAISAVQVYFVRVNEDSSLLDANEVIRSNFSRKKQVYLLNCEPGRYVAVGAELSSRGTGVTYKVVLDRATIADTEVSVERGSLAFMGDLLVDGQVKINRADAEQSHFLRIVEPDASRLGYMARGLLGRELYLGTELKLDRAPATERNFLAFATRKVFQKDPQWLGVVRTRLASTSP
jgi:hypothetical protein